MDRIYRINKHSRRAYVAAFLIKVDQRLRYMSDLRRYLRDHPALAWAIGFPLAADGSPRLPGARQFGRVLRHLDNAALQFLLTATLHLIQAELGPDSPLGNVISLDTKLIIASGWVSFRAQSWVSFQTQSTPSPTHLPRPLATS